LEGKSGPFFGLFVAIIWPFFGPFIDTV